MITIHRRSATHENCVFKGQRSLREARRIRGREIKMNATSLYVSTCRLVLQADLEEPNSWTDLYRLVPYLRQSLSCTVCSNLLIEPHTPTETNCQHHVCRGCRGGRKKLKPSCGWCKDYEKYVENVQLRILLQCYKKLCEYLTSTSIYRTLLLAVSNSGNQSNGSQMGAQSLMELIQEGTGFKDEFKSTAGLSKSAYSILPCVYNTSTISTQTQASVNQTCEPQTSTGTTFLIVFVINFRVFVYFSLFLFGFYCLRFSFVLHCFDLFFFVLIQFCLLFIIFSF